MTAKLAVLASGRGSNFLAVIEAARRKELDAVARVVVSDRAKAPVLGIARRHGIPAVYVPYDRNNREEFERRACDLIDEKQCDLVILAGFMRILTPHFVQRYSGRILNIHPSLLPAFKGRDAQSQALRYGVKITGCTVHLVTEEMDAGPILGQRAVAVLEDDTEETLSARILREEHRLYAEVIQAYSRQLLRSEATVS